MALADKKRKIFDGRYEILSIVGRGACSVVYHARHVTNDGGEVALKVLLDKKQLDSSTERLRKEALAMVTSRHRYVIRLDDFHSVGDLCYLAMEYASLGDLRQYLLKMESKPLTSERGELYLLQCAEAINHIHQAGIVHRDIKPENILLVNDKSIRLCDFSVAVLPGEEVSLENLQAGVGTMDYMAPEVLRGETYDQRSDIYALGVTFYELLTGVHPFSNKPLADQLEVRKDKNIKGIRELNPEIPDYLATVVSQAMSFESQQRFPSAKEFMQTILIQKTHGATSIRSRKPLQKKELQPSQEFKKERKSHLEDPSPNQRKQESLQVSNSDSVLESKETTLQQKEEKQVKRSMLKEGRIKGSSTYSPGKIINTEKSDNVKSEVVEGAKESKRELSTTEDSLVKAEEVKDTSPVIEDSSNESAIKPVEKTGIKEGAKIIDFNTKVQEKKEQSQASPAVLEIQAQMTPPEENKIVETSAITAEANETEAVEKDTKEDISVSVSEATELNEGEEGIELSEEQEVAVESTSNEAQAIAEDKKESKVELFEKEPQSLQSVVGKLTGSIDSAKVAVQSSAIVQDKALRSRLVQFAILGFVMAVVFVLFLKLQSSNPPQVSQQIKYSESELAKQLVPSYAGEELIFPILPNGLYSGWIKDVIPGVESTLSIISIRDAQKMIFILGVEGWSPVMIDFAKLQKENKNLDGQLKVASNGIVLKMIGRGVDGLLVGEFTNLITGDSGQWQLSPSANTYQ